MERLTRLVTSINASAADWPDTPTKAAAAYWVGRVVGFLEGPGNNRKVTEAFEKPDRDYRELLAEAFHDPFEAGVAATRNEHQNFLAAIDALEKNSQSDQDGKRQDQRDAIADRRGELEEKQDNIHRTKEQWKEWLDDQLQQADETLERLEKDYVALEERAVSIQRSIRTLGFEINLLTQIADGRVDDPTLSRTGARRELFLRNQQLLEYRTQLNAASRQAEIVKRNAQATINQRGAAEKRYEKETKTILAKNKKLAIWSKRLERKEQRLEDKPLPLAAELVAAKRRLDMLRSYVPLDWDIEKARILKSYAKAGAIDTPSVKPEEGE